MYRFASVGSLLLAALCATWLVPAQSSAADRPNIVFILADDWGWGDLHCQGHDRIRTPNLDRLASQGTRYTQYYQCSGVCSPSRAALMTGRFPAELALHGHLAGHQLNVDRAMPDALDPSLPTLPRLLQKAGYKTGHFGKWHLSPGEDDPQQYGFDSWKVATGGASWDLWKVENRPRSTELIVDETIAFIEKNKEQPFYVQAWLLDTHAILNPTDEQLAAYPNLQPANIRFTSPAHVFYSAATAADAQIGRLLRKLDSLNLTSNTLVIFSSDNGPEAMEIGNATHSGVGSPGPFRGRKRSLYEGGVRVPFIVRWPGHTKANTVDNDSVIAGCDFLPTLAAITGASIPENTRLVGEDRSVVLNGVPTPRTTTIFWEWRFRIMGHPWNRSPILSVREGKWKLLFNPDNSRVELYDIPADPMELNSLAGQNSDVVGSLSSKALAWQATLPKGPLDPGAGTNTYNWPKPLPASAATPAPAP